MTGETRNTAGPMGGEGGRGQSQPPNRRQDMLRGGRRRPATGQDVVAPGQLEAEGTATGAAPLPAKSVDRPSRVVRHGGSELYMGDPSLLAKKDKALRSIVALAVALPFVVLAAVLLPSGTFAIGSTAVHDFAWWRSALVDNFAAFGNYLSGVSDNNGIEHTFWRYCTIVFAGAGLAVAGAVSQGTLKNYMASPSTLGVVSGGTLGAVIFVLLFEFEQTGLFITNSQYQQSLAGMDAGHYLLEVFGRQCFSLAGCVLVTALVLGVAYVAGHGKLSNAALVVTGQVFASVAAAVTGLVRYWVTYQGTEEQLRMVTQLTNGVVENSVSPLSFAALALPVGICLAVLFFGRKSLNLLAFSDDEARSMGMSVARSRMVVMLLCALITAFVVSFCGAIGFVGFMVPHLMRRVVGADLKYLLPGSMVAGALFLVIAYRFMTACNLLNGALGLFSTVIGTVFFVISLIVQRRRGNASWN